MSAPTENGNHKRPKSRSDNAYPRKRALQACQTCRVRRTKCDNGRPSCAACRALGAECVYREKDNSSFDQGTLTILDRLDNLEALLLSPSNRNLPASANSQIAPRLNADGQSVLSPINFSSPILLEESDSFSHSVTVEGILSWPLWKGRYNNSPPLKELLLLNSDKPDFPSPTLGRPPADHEVLGQEQLVANYFEQFHIFNPVIDERQVADFRREVQVNGYGWDAKSCLLLLVFALGHFAEAEEFWAGAPSSSDWKQSPAFQNADACFVSAKKRFGLLLTNSGVLEAQCLFLAGVYLATTLRPLEAWRMFSQAVACCESFHPFQSRDQGSSSEGKYERSIQDSIFWTCFKSELELRLELQISEFALRDFKYPVFFPSPPQDLLPEKEPAWYFYLAEIALQRLRGRILYHAYKCQTSGVSVLDMVDMVLNFEQQAREWMTSLPPVLALDKPPHDGDAPEHGALRLILRGHLLDCFEVMYWPFLQTVLNSDMSVSSTASQLSPTILSFAQKGLDVCIDRIEQTSSGYRSRHHGTWLTLRSNTRSALILMTVRAQHLRSATETMAGKHLRLPGSLLPCVSKVIELLKFWQHECGDVSNRLHILESLLLVPEEPSPSD